MPDRIFVRIKGDNTYEVFEPSSRYIANVQNILLKLNIAFYLLFSFVQTCDMTHDKKDFIYI